MGITTVPPMQPQDKIPLRIHTVDHTCCRLQVRVDSTAKAIIKEACAKLQLDPANFNLCEVKSSGEKNPLDDNDISVHSEISVNGRLYIVPKSHSEKTVVCLCLCKYMYVQEFCCHSTHTVYSVHVNVCMYTCSCLSLK